MMKFGIAFIALPANPAQCVACEACSCYRMVCPVCFVTGDRNLVVLDDAVSFSEGSTPTEFQSVVFLGSF
jgi:hypothetical protein